MKDGMSLEPWVDAAKVAEHTGFKEDHIRVLARSGKLPASQMGTGKKLYWRFKLSLVDQFMEANLNTSKVA